jgi:hypothetical protein
MDVFFALQFLRESMADDPGPALLLAAAARFERR